MLTDILIIEPYSQIKPINNFENNTRHKGVTTRIHGYMNFDNSTMPRVPTLPSI